MPRSERGQVLVEFTLSVLVFLVLVFGVLDFGRALYTYHAVSYAARAGTRYAIVRGSACNGVVSGCPATRGSVTDYIESVSPNLNPRDLRVSVNWITGNTGCPAGTAPTNSPGCSVQVAITYRFIWLFSFLPATTMTSTSQMVISQ
ncbi:MAG TPA: TadE/TadG family type IV pilus assembly protein [Terriglobia bacterium]|nr:TadE/TadG family type IV pilus assembly protein [Terriglobia bacterium]